MDRIGETKKENRAGGLSAARLLFYLGLGLLSAGAGFAVAGLMGGAGGLWQGGFKPAAAEREPSAESAPPGRLIHRAEPLSVRDFAFTSADGKLHRLSDWRGKVVLLNLWATWCAPCEAEMPSLDRLQAKLGSGGFAVLALSMDRTGPDKPQSFFAGNGITHLAIYMDSAGQAAASVRASGLPVSIILDRRGREVARLIGPAEWDSAATAAKVEEYINSRGSPE